MPNLTLRDPFAPFWPRWMDDFDQPAHKSLKIHETDTDIIAEAIVAGVPAEDVEVNIEDGILTIKAETKHEENKKGEYQASSRSYYYTAALSGGAWDKTAAKVKNGVVTVTIPKAEAAKPRKVKVLAEG